MTTFTTIRLPEKLRARRTTQTVPQVVYAARALGHIERTFQFLRDKNPAAALVAVTAVQSAVQSAVDNLAAHPLVGRRVEGELRELIISYGQTGYVALYRFVISRNEVRILAIRHQREMGYLP